MKGFRSTWALFGLVGLLAAYTYYEFRNKSKEAPGLAEGEVRLFTLKEDQVDRFEVNAKGQIYALERRGDDWFMTKPVEDLADKAVVDSFLYSVLDQRAKEFLTSDELKSVDWPKYGLDQPSSSIEVISQEKSEKFEISSKNAFDGSFYIKIKDQPKLGDRSLAQLLERNPSSFRNKYVWGAGRDAKIKTASVTPAGSKGAEPFTLTYKDELWTVNPKPKYELSTNQIENWVSDLKDLKASEIVEEAPADLKPYGLTNPRAEIKLDYTREGHGDESLTLFISGQIGDDVFLRTDKRPTVYKMAARSVAKVSVPLIYFKEGQSPFQFPLEVACSLDIETKKGRVSIVKADEKWTLADEKSEYELSVDKLVEFFQKVRDLDAREYLKKGQGWPKEPQLVIRDKDKKVLLWVQWGEKYKATEPYNLGESFYYVKSSLTPEVLGVSQSQIDKLIDPALLKTKPKADEKAEKAHKANGHP